jgi:hypothetical protein
MMRRDTLMNALMNFTTEFVAIDDGGLAIVETEEDGRVTENYIEVGGVPERDPDWEQDTITESQEMDSIDNQNGDGT